MSVAKQVHSKFEVFIGESLSDVASKVEEFTKSGSVAAKSIGIEYIEQTKQFLLSLGYAEGQEGYAVSISETPAGQLPVDGATGALAQALETAADAAGEVICHELYVDDAKEVHIVFMAKA